MVLKEMMGSLSIFATRGDDDIVDRLHYFVTSNLLVALSILVSFKQFGGKPIECMVPEMFPGGWEQYAENYCWAQDTYFLPFSEAEIPTDELMRQRQRIGYYQWVPFFLIIEAACFWLPAMLWKLLAGHSGMRVEHIVRIATDTNNIKPDIRKNTIRILTVHLENALRFHRRSERRQFVPHRYLRCLNMPYSACYVSSIYLFTKSVYLANVVIQFFTMNWFLIGGNYNSEIYDWYSYYGWGALSDMVNGTTWHNSGVFPRVTLCDFQIRSVGSNVQQFTIQCVLVINLFNEKIFVFLWFWYVILILLTALSTLYWGLLLIVPQLSRSYIARHLELSEMPFNRHDDDSKRLIHRFVSSYLKTDGMFVIRMATMHTSIIFGTDLVLSLWQSFYGIEAGNYRKGTSTELSEEARKQEMAMAMKGGQKASQPPEGTFNVLRMRAKKGAQGDESGDELKEVLVDKQDPERDLTDGGNVNRGGFGAKTFSSTDNPPEYEDDDDDEDKYWVPRKISASKRPPRLTMIPSAPGAGGMLSINGDASPQLAGYRRTEI